MLKVALVIGTVLVGTNEERIVARVASAVDQGIDHELRRDTANPYVDGHSAARIATTLVRRLSMCRIIGRRK